MAWVLPVVCMTELSVLVSSFVMTLLGSCALRSTFFFTFSLIFLCFFLHSPCEIGFDSHALLRSSAGVLLPLLVGEVFLLDD